MTDHTPITATVSGSFRQAMRAVQEAVYRLTDVGVRVLSPADPRVVDQFGGFLFVASDQVRSIKLVESRHLAAIAASDFLWLVAPDGYVGLSSAMELGFAASAGTPVYCSEVPADLTLRQYVTALGSPEEAAKAIVRGTGDPVAAGRPNVLLEPDRCLQLAHDALEDIGVVLSDATTRTPNRSARAADLVHRIIAPLRDR